MSGDTAITLVGNLTADPELRFTQAGVAVAGFTVASTPRVFDRASGEWKDGECAGINRHGGGDENALHRGCSEPRWPRVMRRRP